MAGDAVSYSQLMAANGPATILALDEARHLFRKHVTSHGGVVVDTAGDSILAVFDTASGAVDAAVSAQAELELSSVADAVRLRFRVGLHLGDLFEKPDGTVYGDSVNLASRLQALAPPGCVVVSEAVRGVVQGKIEVAFTHFGLHAVKNIAEPVSAYVASRGPSRATAPLINQAPQPESTDEKPSIAVLPFTYLGGDPEQAFLADGMCEDVTTLLASVSSFIVIARGSTFAFKANSVDVRAIAKDLRVRYVLQGSLRRSGARIRVAAQFVDAERGHTIWAETYDRAVEDIFEVQDDVARAIVASLQARFLDAEFAFVSRQRPEVLGAWGNVVRAKVKLFAFRRGDLDEAEPFARRAVEIDPAYGEAHAVLGHILAWRAFNRWTDDWLLTAREAATSCARALQLASNNASVLTDVGAAYWFLGRLIPAATLLEKSQTLNANCKRPVCTH